MNLSPINIYKLDSAINAIFSNISILHRIGLNFDFEKMHQLKNKIKTNNQYEIEHELKNFFEEIIQCANSTKKTLLSDTAANDLKDAIKSIESIIDENSNFKIQAIDSLKDELIYAMVKLTLLSNGLLTQEINPTANIPSFLVDMDYDEENFEDKSSQDVSSTNDKKEPQRHEEENKEFLKPLSQNENKSQNTKKIIYDKFDPKEINEKNFFMAFNDTAKRVFLLKNNPNFSLRSIPVNVKTNNSDLSKIDDAYCELQINDKLYYVKITFFTNNNIEIIDASKKAESTISEKITQYEKTHHIVSTLKSIKAKSKKHSISMNPDKPKSSQKKMVMRYSFPPLIPDDNKKFYKVMIIDHNNHRNSIDIFYDTEQNIKSYAKKNESKNIYTEATELTIEKSQENHTKHIHTTNQSVVIKDTDNKKYAQKMSIAYDKDKLEYSIFLSNNQQKNEKSIKPTKLLDKLNDLIKKNLNPSLPNKTINSEQMGFAFFIGNSLNDKKIEELKDLGIIFDLNNFFFITKADIENIAIDDFKDFIFVDIIKKEEKDNDYNKNQIMRTNIKFKINNKDVILNFFVELSDDKSKYNLCFNEVKGSISEKDFLFDPQDEHREYTINNIEQIKKLYKLFKLKYNHLIEKKNDYIDKRIKEISMNNNSDIDPFSLSDAFSDETQSEEEERLDKELKSKYSRSLSDKQESKNYEVSTNLKFANSDKASDSSKTTRNK